MIRISGGEFRSRLLETPSTGLTKPTMDKVRAAVFSALQNQVLNAEVLDLFAGSGSYGFESLSRGAKKVTFVDKNKEAIKVIKRNSETLGVKDVDIVMSDAVMFLKETDKKFDLIFVDPPYALEVYDDVVNIVLEKELLKPNGALILESERELNLPKDKFKEIRFYKYGLAKIYLIRN